GLVYMQQRYYDPGIGRFLSTDPVAADANTGANFNRYWYANNNPYRYSDPFGLYACSSKVNSGDCAQIDALVNKINQSLKGLNKNSNDFKSLSAVSKFLGTKNDGNGVTIETASLGKNVVGQPSGLKTIQLDMKKITGPLGKV
ncbi:RHS repeat-associated core domain-containing protein, partial [Thiomonas sp.]|uniref:RHS repeat-associated core domain-containing protein n=1 Tax=Thiomonas sp. TaxID=2047785 RepID=UPI00258849A6